MRGTRVVLGLCLAVLGGCVNSNYKVTGQVEMVGTDGDGNLTSTDDKNREPRSSVYLTEGKTVSIRLSSVFVREGPTFGGSEYLIYAEIFDVQPDDSQRLVRVLFKDTNQGAGFLINQRDRLVFGPIAYNGNPIRVRLFVVRLNRQNNEVLSNVLKTAAQVATTMYPAAGPFVGPAQSIGDLFVQLNQDDKELVHDFTLYPRTHDRGPYLMTGEYVVMKTENVKRLKQQLRILTPEDYDQRPENYEPDAGRVYDWFGVPISGSIEDYTKVFQYYPDYHGERHPLLEDGPFIRHVAHRVQDGQLWFDTVAIEYVQQYDRDRRNGASEKKPAVRQIVWQRDQDERQQPPSVNGFRFVVRRVGGPGTRRLQLVATRGKDQYMMDLDKRVQYREKTHAIITVAEGGKPVGRELFEQMSTGAQQILDNSLQPEVAAATIGRQIKTIEAGVIKAVVTNRVISQVNAGTGKTAVARTSADVPLAYLRQLRVPSLSPGENVTDDSTLSGANLEIVKRNEAIVEIVRGMCDSFPYSAADARDTTKISEMKALTKDRFKPNGVDESKPADQRVGDGTYTFVATG